MDSTHRAAPRCSNGDNKVYLCHGQIKGKSGCHFTFEFYDNAISKADLMALPLSPEQTSTKRYLTRKTPTTNPNRTIQGGVDSKERLTLEESSRPILRKDSRKDRDLDISPKIVFEERVQVFTYVPPKAYDYIYHSQDSSDSESSDEEAERSIAEPAKAEDLRANAPKSKITSPNQRPISTRQREPLTAWTHVRAAPTVRGMQALAAQSQLIERNLEKCNPPGNWVTGFKSYFFWSCQTDNEA